MERFAVQMLSYMAIGIHGSSSSSSSPLLSLVQVPAKLAINRTCNLRLWVRILGPADGGSEQRAFSPPSSTEVCYTQVSGPVQTTYSNTLSSIHTRLFSHITVYNPTKDSIVYVYLHAHALQITLNCSPASCFTYNVSLCTCTVFI